MKTQVHRLEVVANNLANADTPGFKRDLAVVTARPSFPLHRLGDAQNKWQLPIPPAVGDLSFGALIDEATYDLTDGMLDTTGNPFDLALQGDGFFAVQTSDGVRYTRQGNFRVDAQGRLVTQAGDPLLGVTGPIGTDFTVDATGRVFSGGVQRGQLQIVSVANRLDLVKEGSSLYRLAENGRTTASSATVVQGALEQPNFSAVTEMVSMISIMRAYEANQKVVQAHDQGLDKLWNEVARV